MRALCWYGSRDVRVETVPDPQILNPHDAIVKITLTTVCGSDLHLYEGLIPTLEKGDILGHEFMGEIVETGDAVTKLRRGDKIVVPFNIACGRCFFCEKTQFSACDNTNPNGHIGEKLYGYPPAALFGYSHMMGGYAGGQAQYVRVPHVDVNSLKVPAGLSDEKVLFLSDIFPTGYMAAENCNIQPGDTVAVWGAGPVGLFAIKSAYMLGAREVIAIDRFPDRLEKARKDCMATVLNYQETDDVLDALKSLTGGRGPDACIDAVGMEAHGTGLDAWYDRAKQTLMLESDRPTALRQIIMACRKGGTVSIPGVYGGLIDKFPFGAAFNKGLTFKMGQTHTQRYMKKLLDRILTGEIDPSFVISHKLSLEDTPRVYEMFQKKQDHALKVVLDPWATAS